jgi:hypothetical protein
MCRRPAAVVAVRWSRLRETPDDDRRHWCGGVLLELDRFRNLVVEEGVEELLVTVEMTVDFVGRGGLRGEKAQDRNTIPLRAPPLGVPPPAHRSGFRQRTSPDRCRPGRRPPENVGRYEPEDAVEFVGMTSPLIMRFDRRISTELLDALGSGGFLHGLLPRRNACPTLLDLQGRRESSGRRSWVSLYAGLSSVLDVDERGGLFRLCSHPTYQRIGGFDALVALAGSCRAGRRVAEG